MFGMVFKTKGGSQAPDPDDLRQIRTLINCSKTVRPTCRESVEIEDQFAE